MAKKENQLSLSRQKGWKGYVATHHIYAKLHDTVKWGKGSKKPKEVSVDKMGKIIQKW